MTDARACFIGDSYVLGVGDSTLLGWPGRVGAAAWAEGRKLTVYNLGVRGDTGADILARAPVELGARFSGKLSPRALIVAFGANDLRLRHSTEDSVLALKGLLALADTHSATPLVVSPVVRDAPLAALAEAFAEVCLDAGVAYLDLRTSDVDWAEWWRQAEARDGAHPAASSYEAYAQTFAAWTPWRSWLSGAA